MANEKRLIDANALVWSIGIGDDGKQFFYVKAENIDNSPTVDAVEVVHGRWEKQEPDKHGNRKPKCSVCGEYHLAWWSDYTHCYYCPNCGAKMDGDGNG